MNNTERKLDEMLRQLQKKEYDLDGWLSEDETATFDRIVAGRKARTIPMRWPWVAAAACLIIIGVASVMKFSVQPTPPPRQEASASRSVTPPTTVIASAEKTPTPPEIKVPVTKPARKARRTRPATTTQPPLAQAQQSTEESALAETVDNETETTEPRLAEAKPVTLTERDIPITRPENYKFTPEEIALLKKQAHEAYIKWMQLELEIAKHYLEQTAQQ